MRTTCRLPHTCSGGYVVPNRAGVPAAWFATAAAVVYTCCCLLMHIQLANVRLISHPVQVGVEHVVDV